VGGAVIRVAATGLCRSDWHGWQGHDPDIATLPHVPGHEFAGTVASIGDGVLRVRVGDRVVVPFVCGCGTCALCESGNAQVCPHQWQPDFNGPGSYAEFVAVPNADFNLVALPDAVTFPAAASLGCRFATAYRGVVDVAKVLADDVVAVFGCGGVGLAAVMIARSRGARVIAIDVNDAALRLASSVGANETINAATEDAVAAIRRLLPMGVDVTVDALGSIVTAAAAVQSLRIQGRHLQLGLLPPAAIGDHATVPMHLVIGRELSVFGSHGMAAAHYPRLLDDVARGVLAPQELIVREIPLDDAPEALAAMSWGTDPGVTIIRP
jgi:alcohol dehydrogenase